MDPSFEAFVSQLQHTSKTLGYYSDFDKISSHIEDIRISLHLLNSLIGAEDLPGTVHKIWALDRTTFRTLALLIAVRDASKELVLDPGHGAEVSMKSYFESEEGVLQFLEETGLGAMLTTKRINNLVDYALGVETGLDTNARKNRSGKMMEALVEARLKEAGIPYSAQQSGNLWEPVRAALGADRKRFDFVVRTRRSTYLIEVNFYNSTGSKPNEVARAYSDLAPKINALPGFDFVWVTDGNWETSQNKLEEAYRTIPLLYNLSTFDRFIERVKSEGLPE